MCITVVQLSIMSPCLSPHVKNFEAVRARGADGNSRTTRPRVISQSDLRI